MSSTEGQKYRFGELLYEDMDSEQRRINDWLVETLHPERSGMSSTIGGPMDALLLSPEMADPLGRMVPLIYERLVIPRDAIELAILQTASHCHCRLEFQIHRPHAINAGIDAHVVDALESREVPELGERLEAVFAFTTQLLSTFQVDDSTFNAIVRLWGKRGAVELTGVVGYYTLLAFVINVDR